MIAAFFDMDRTLIRCNSGSLWLKFLRERGEISTWTLLRASIWLLQYKLAVLDMESVTTRAIADIRGDSEKDMIDKCLVFTREQVLPHVAQAGLAALGSHKQSGHLVAILSSSTPYVTEPLAKHLGIEHVLCTRLSVSDGRFDGTHVKPACYGKGKVVWAEEFARQHDIDLSRSFFYTDSYSDLPMLERVGEKVVVNPDPRLRRHAKKAGWRVETW